MARLGRRRGSRCMTIPRSVHLPFSARLDSRVGGFEQSDFYVTLLANAVPMTCRNVEIRRWQRLSVTQLPSFPWNSEGIRNPSLSGAI